METLKHQIMCTQHTKIYVEADQFERCNKTLISTNLSVYETNFIIINV